MIWPLFSWPLFSYILFLTGLAASSARPNEKEVKTLSATAENPDHARQTYADPLATEDETKPLEENGRSSILLDASKLKEMLAEGNARSVVDAVQRALGAEQPFRVRTQWGGPEYPNLGNAVRNTVDWKAYNNGKKSLDIIMDSKFSRGSGKVSMIDPSLGFSFQMRY